MSISLVSVCKHSNYTIDEIFTKLLALLQKKSYLCDYFRVVNGKSAIEWIVERYAVTQDKKSLIKNDANDWARDRSVISWAEICNFLQFPPVFND